ncbi:OLC1v1027762C1 [Oldenlandia corymbosa var. corymbosa]|uniref:OLC1v1027762C1 n=1 Tax=Oldenlandia corymbosa var. corymbosa TaxID=529605 RepID=A0AAV1CDD3_OLDCO|nr:OLC1v1027762C1 [Oldenlandia corymbosa var. corymbosa]
MDLGTFSVQIFIYCIILIQPKLGHSFQPALILPLKTKQISSASLPKLPNRVGFHHNVTLTVSLNVGSPPQPVTMVLDTGSELPWLHCSHSSTAAKNKNNLAVFNPQLSSSYSPVNCSTDTCRTRTRDLTLPVSCDPNKLCHAILSYADFSSVEGNLATETFAVGNSGIPGFVFGCMDSSSSTTPDEDSVTTGLIGMNRGTLSLISQLGLPQFSYCISSRDSSGVLTLGSANFSWVGSLKYTPLIQISTPLPSFDRLAYTVELEGIKVSDTILPLPKSVLVPDHTGAGQTMVDSGTQFTFLIGQAYTALKNEFMKQTASSLRLLNESDFVFQGALDLCYRVGSKLPALPAVTLMFRGADFRVAGEYLLYKVPGETRGTDAVYCFTFGNSDLLGIEAYVIGNHHQQNKWMEFDVANSRLGLTELGCDSASQRLGF